MIWLIGIIVALILICGCIFVYHSAEHHELHKMRAAFEKVEKNLYDYFKNERETVSHDGVTFGELPKETVAGAGFAVQKMLEMLDKEDAEIDHEFMNAMRNFLVNHFHGKE